MKVRKREQSRVEELKPVHPLTGRDRRVMGTTHLAGIESETHMTQNEKSCVKCKSCVFICRAQTF